mmetsp:Transcript_21209/g.66518  ORF Transcript_21209/g.66518 Transcript_21209/m.66518 type:complete len:672 (+) Transcript_21209:60-2075(+)
MANPAVWAVGLIIVVTLALISIVSTYDRGINAIVRQPGVSAASAPAYLTPMAVSTNASTFAWLQDALTRLRQDDRVAEAIRLQIAETRAAGPVQRLPTIAPAVAAQAAADAPLAIGAFGARASRAPAGAGTLAAAARGSSVDMGAFGKDLTRELVGKCASADKMIIVSFVNAHYMDFARNWVRHLVSAGNPHFLVGALDDEAYKQLRAANVPSFDMAASLTTRDFGWGSKVFKQAQQKKIAMFLSVLEYGYDVLLSDIDVFYLRDPFVFFRTVPEADLLVSSDLLTNTVTDDGPETQNGIGATLNVGIIFMRPTNATKALTREWNDMCSRNLDFWEQAAFNQLVRRRGVARGAGGAAVEAAAPDRARGQYGDRVVPMYHSAVPTAVLPVSQFCSGHTGFVQHMPERLGKEPYAVHATFQFAGTNGKRHRMREWLVWEDEPAYYDPPGGLLAVDVEPPAELLHPGGRPPSTVAHHFDLVNWQLSRIRSGLVLAELTGRVLVMPKLWCGFDRWWAPHTGRIPGSNMPLPIQCPLDHVFNIEQGLRPDLIRAFSFLRHPRVPQTVLASQHNLTLPADLSAPTVTAALKDPAAVHAKVLRIADTPPDVYQRTLTAEQQNAFAKRAFNYLGIWCCIRPPARGKPGHIWYDLFWDIIPHTDRWRQTWSDAWVPRPSK